MASIRNPKDLAAGLLFVLLGLGFEWFGRELDTGTAFRMGPGYFPTVLAWIMVALGAVIAVSSIRTEPSEFGGVAWRGIVLIVGATIVFGVVLRGLGLVPALLIVVFATCWASIYARLLTTIALSVALTVFCVLVFIWGLGLPIRLVGPWLDFGAAPPPASAPASPAPAAPAQTPPAQ